MSTGFEAATPSFSWPPAGPSSTSGGGRLFPFPSGGAPFPTASGLGWGVDRLLGPSPCPCPDPCPSPCHRPSCPFLWEDPSAGLGVGSLAGKSYQGLGLRGLRPGLAPSACLRRVLNEAPEETLAPSFSCAWEASSSAEVGPHRRYHRPRFCWWPSGLLRRRLALSTELHRDSGDRLTGPRPSRRCPLEAPMPRRPPGDLRVSCPWGSALVAEVTLLDRLPTIWGSGWTRPSESRPCRVPTGSDCLRGLSPSRASTSGFPAERPRLARDLRRCSLRPLGSAPGAERPPSALLRSPLPRP
jgi:hypothetical protein